MGQHLSPWDNAKLQFTSAEDAAGFESVLRECLGSHDFVAGFDQLTGSNLRLSGTPIEVAIDLTSGRAEVELQRFASFVKDTVWDRLPAVARLNAG